MVRLADYLEIKHLDCQELRVLQNGRGFIEQCHAFEWKVVGGAIETARRPINVYPDTVVDHYCVKIAGEGCTDSSVELTLNGQWKLIDNYCLNAGVHLVVNEKEWVGPHKGHLELKISPPPPTSFTGTVSLILKTVTPVFNL